MIDKAALQKEMHNDVMDRWHIVSIEDAACGIGKDIGVKDENNDVQITFWVQPQKHTPNVSIVALRITKEVKKSLISEIERVYLLGNQYKIEKEGKI